MTTDIMSLVQKSSKLLDNPVTTCVCASAAGCWFTYQYYGLTSRVSSSMQHSDPAGDNDESGPKYDLEEEEAVEALTKAKEVGEIAVASALTAGLFSGYALAVQQIFKNDEISLGKFVGLGMLGLTYFANRKMCQLHFAGHLD